MSGLRYLFISNDLKVYRIPSPKDGVYKAVPQLADQLVLEVILYYDTKDRKPYRLLNVFYDRLRLDSEGKYENTQQETEIRLRNFYLFGFQTPETLSKEEEPIPIPSTIVTPTSPEKDSLIKHIKSTMPLLYPGSVYVIEKSIQSCLKANKRDIDFVKEVARLKYMNK